MCEKDVRTYLSDLVEKLSRQLPVGTEQNNESLQSEQTVRQPRFQSIGSPTQIKCVTTCTRTLDRKSNFKCCVTVAHGSVFIMLIM
jgi:hypothetical protein